MLRKPTAIEDDDALQNPLVVGRHSAEIQQIVEHRDEQDAEERPKHASSSAGQNGAADHDRRDRLQRQRGADARVADARLGHKEDCREPGAKAGQRVDAGS